ncbi:MAG: PIG-L family deacetylase [Fimbriimonadales bacterium]|nr:PIG-L family deacetylase [Fimbriimonadales bacterium]
MRRWLGRIALAVLGGLSSYIGLSVLLFVAATHRASLSQELHAWQQFPPLAPDDRLLIVAPHPDDEVLGCGGLIATATAQGIPVRVVYLTAGDGFAAAAAFTARSAPDARDCLLLGQLRMRESRSALRALGVGAEDAVFLGYPDRGLLPMATRPNRTVRSAATRATVVPYAEAHSPNAPYTAAALVADLRAMLAAFQPTRVFTTHPLDDHEDHTAAALFTREAIAQAIQAGELRRTPMLYYYLVHRGDWPLPQGEHPDRYLTPPPSLSGQDWQVFPLRREAQQAKRAALHAHASQYALMRRFLGSFLRQNEIFAPAPAPRTQYDLPFDDNPAIHLQPRADLTSVQVQAGRAGVRVSLETLKPLRTPYRVELVLLTVDTAGNWSETRWRYPNRRLTAKQEGATVHLWLPYRPIADAERAYLMVSVKLYGAELDRTGFLPIALPERAGWDAPTRRSALQSAP